MSIEAMKQALEALECLFGIPEQFTGKGGGDVAVWTLGGSYRAQQAIPVLRQAIEQAEKQEPVAFNAGVPPLYPEMKDGETISVEYLETIPQPQQEPSAWRDHASDYERGFIDGMQKQMQSSVDKAVNAMSRQAEKQEPVAWCVTYNGELTGNIFENKRIADLCKRNLEAKYGSEEDRKVVAIYTTPQPQREWVGLTQQDIDIAFDDTQEGGGFNEFARAIEQTLRRKNT